MIKETIHISLRDPAELLNRDQDLDMIAAGRISPEDHQKGSRTENKAGGQNLGLGDVFFVDMCNVLTI